jgi:hypothetical protein
VANRKTIRLPKYESANDHDTQQSHEVDYDQLAKRLKSQLDLAPSFIKTLKRVDNEGWQELIDDVLEHAKKNPEFRNLVRAVTKGEQQGVSVGDPNWVHLDVLLLVTAFGIGYAIGTACYNAGPCNFVP